MLLLFIPIRCRDCHARFYLLRLNTKWGAYKTLCCGAEIVIRASVAFNHPKLSTRRKLIADADPNVYVPRPSKLKSFK